MPLVWTIVGSLGHAVSAVLFASLAILTSRRAGRQLEAQLIVIALALTALWSLRHALGGALIGETLSDGVTETIRNAAWLAVCWAHLRLVPSSKAMRIGRPLVVISLALLLLTQLAFDLLVGESVQVAPGFEPVLHASWLLRCMFGLGGLLLVHGMSSRRDHPGQGQGAMWMSAALAFLWAYDVNHYFLAWVSGNPVVMTGPARGFVVALLAIPMAIGLRMNSERRFAISRPAAMRLVSAAIIAVYLLTVLLLVTMTGELAAPLGRLVQIAMLFALAVAVLALLPSAALRSWIRVEITKHFFAHRYDYRAVWLGFAAAVDRNGTAQDLLGDRLTRAIAETVQAQGAILFLRDQDGGLMRRHDWNWPSDAEPIGSFDMALADKLEASGWILDVAVDWASFARWLPAWMNRSSHAWVLAPLIHGGKLIGVILLAQPPVARRIDWEDLDVLRTVCGEAAALISEEHSRTALAEAQRFEEFNRRFAFILHDIKNLVSQMSLLASNAERHADNPAFRADMVLTLKEIVSRMNDLLARLGRPGTQNPGGGELIELGGFVRSLLPRWQSGIGPVNYHGNVYAMVRIDREALERALGHLVKNGVEASPAQSGVQIGLAVRGDRAILQVRDEGCGMSAEFIREELFRPFSSTKANGFGLGVHEVQLLIRAMEGALEVVSEPGKGTCFTISLPLAVDNQRRDQSLSTSHDGHDQLRRVG